MLLGTTIANNSPINFAGEAGNLTQNSYAILDATLDTTGNFTTGTLRIPVVDVQDAMGITLYSAVLQLMTGSTDTFELISATELLPATSGRVASVPGFHDNPSYDVATNVVIFPFVVFDTGTDTQRWYAELEFIPPTTPTDPNRPNKTNTTNAISLNSAYCYFSYCFYSSPSSHNRNFSGTKHGKYLGMGNCTIASE